MSGRGPRAKGIVAEVSLFFAAVFVGLDFVSVKPLPAPVGAEINTRDQLSPNDPPITVT